MSSPDWGDEVKLKIANQKTAQLQSPAKKQSSSVVHSYILSEYASYRCLSDDAAFRYEFFYP